MAWLKDSNTHLINNNNSQAECSSCLLNSVSLINEDMGNAFNRNVGLETLRGEWDSAGVEGFDNTQNNVAISQFCDGHFYNPTDSELPNYQFSPSTINYYLDEDAANTTINNIVLYDSLYTYGTDAREFTFSISSSSGNIGSLSSPSDGIINYTRNSSPSFGDIDEFTITAQDPDGNSVSNSLTIYVLHVVEDVATFDDDIEWVAGTDSGLINTSTSELRGMWLNIEFNGGMVWQQLSFDFFNAPYLYGCNGCIHSQAGEVNSPPYGSVEDVDSPWFLNQESYQPIFFGGAATKYFRFTVAQLDLEAGQGLEVYITGLDDIGTGTDASVDIGTLGGWEDATVTLGIPSSRIPIDIGSGATPLKFLLRLR